MFSLTTRKVKSSTFIVLSISTAICIAKIGGYIFTHLTKISSLKFQFKRGKYFNDPGSCGFWTYHAFTAQLSYLCQT